MLELKSFHQPRSMSQALGLLEKHGKNAQPLAGGTSLALSRSSSLDVLVDLSRVEGLDRIEERDDGIHMGAMVTCNALRRYLSPDGNQGALFEAVSSLGSRVLQNHVTVGGNCVMVYAWSDLPVALLCLEGTFILEGRGGRRDLTADDFLSRHPTRVLDKGELLVEVVAPRPAEGVGSAYLKFVLNAADQSMASVATRVTIKDGKVAGARIVVGAVRGMPQLLTDAADTLAGRAPDGPVLAEAAEKAAAEARVTGDYKASAGYRTNLLVSLVEDSLTLAADRASGGKGRAS